MTKMTRLHVVLLIVVGLLVAGFAGANTLEARYQRWMETAQVGAYQPEEEDWDAILAAAKLESPITIYADTSRVLAMVDLFNERFGLRAEAINLRGTEIIERVRREWDAGLYNVDVVLTTSPAMVQEQLMTRKAITRYVPRELLAVIDPKSIEPVLVHRYSVGTWYYKSPDMEVPYSNIWELTTEKWRNKVAMTNPLTSGTTVEYFVGLVANADEMAALYEEFFGHPIRLTTENAGYEFIKRLLDNDVRIVASFRDVATAVSNTPDYFAGFGTQSAYRDVISGVYDFEIDTKINPAVLSPRIIAMGTFTNSPNQAKMMIRWLMSQEGGEPWWGVDFPSSPLVETTGEMAALTLDTFTRLWDTPLELQLELRDDVSDFFILYQ